MTATSERLGSAAPSSAVFSDDRKYRYRLTREWDPGLPPLTFVMLNPSDANETDNDPTVTRCEGFAGDNGFGGLDIFNAYALISSDPKALWHCSAMERIGPENDDWLRYAFAKAHDLSAPVVAAWGTNIEGHRARYIRSMGPLHYLRLTKHGHPGHPLYLPASLKPLEWSP